MSHRSSTPVESLGSNPFRFECATCGSVHEGIPSFGWDYPAQYLAVPEAERATRVHLSDDVCVIDDEWFFIRGSLEIRVHGHVEPLSYGVWLSLSRASFTAYSRLLDQVDRVAGARFFGWLCTAIPGYPDTQLLKTTVHVRTWPARPFIELEPTEHPLALEQRDGVSLWRARQIVERITHTRYR